MKAIILVAGEGKRMRPLTLEQPKPMIEILGRPLLHHILDSLPSEITEVILVIGYKGEVIRRYFGATYEGRTIRYVHQEERRGTAHALALCRSSIKPKERFLFMIGDDLHSPEALKRILRHNLAILVHKHEDPRRFGVVEVDSRGMVTAIIEKPEVPKSNLVSPGVFVLDDRVFNYKAPLHRLGEYFAADQIGAMLKDHAMEVEKSEFWHPIGYPHDIETLEKTLRTKYRLPYAERRTTPVIILAGGTGTRMPENEKDKPKVLVEVAGKPMLQHQIEELHRQGFFNIRLSLGFLAEVVIAWVRKAGYSDIDFVVEPQPLGTGGGLKLAAHGLQEPFIALNSDDLTDVNFLSLIRHSLGGKYNVISGMEIADASAYGLIECDEFKRICAFHEKRPGASGIVNIGHYYLQPDVLRGMPETFSNEYDLFPRLAKEGKLVLHRHMGNYWFGCGTPETLRLTREYFSRAHA